MSSTSHNPALPRISLLTVDSRWLPQQTLVKAIGSWALIDRRQGLSVVRRGLGERERPQLASRIIAKTSGGIVVALLLLFCPRVPGPWLGYFTPSRVDGMCETALNCPPRVFAASCERSSEMSPERALVVPEREKGREAPSGFIPSQADLFGYQTNCGHVVSLSTEFTYYISQRPVCLPRPAAQVEG